nr:Chain B, peptide SSGVDL [Human alphaherpesvirus 1 strain 17]
SSGVDL